MKPYTGASTLGPRRQRGVPGTGERPTKHAFNSANWGCFLLVSGDTENFKILEIVRSLRVCNEFFICLFLNAFEAFRLFVLCIIAELYLENGIYLIGEKKYECIIFFYI